MGQWRFQKEDKTFVQHAFIHGYHFGDVVLEGVFFKVTIDKKNKFHVEVTKDNAAYFKHLNQKYWLKQAVDFAKYNDVFYESVHGEGDDIIVVDEETGERNANIPKPKNPPRVISVASLSSYLR